MSPFVIELQVGCDCTCCVITALEVGEREGEVKEFVKRLRNCFSRLTRG